MPLPQTVYAPQVREQGEDAPATPDAKTALMSGGSGLPPTAVAPAVPAGGTGAGDAAASHPGRCSRHPGAGYARAAAGPGCAGLR